MAAGEAKERALVADDDALVREAVAMTLEDAGYRVTVAADALEGQRLHAAQPFELVIADMRMAGNEELQWIARLAEEHEPPAVLLLTGHPTLDSAIASVRLPVVAYLTKPVDDEQLLASVGEALARRRASSPPPVERRLAIARESLGLTKRQGEVFAHLVRGAANKEIAHELGCAVRTVELHVTALLAKARVTTRNELTTAFWSGELGADDHV